MKLIENHPYSFLLAGAGIVLVVIAATATNQSVSPALQGPLVRVSGGGVLVDPGLANTGALAPTDAVPAPLRGPDTSPLGSQLAPRTTGSGAPPVQTLVSGSDAGTRNPTSPAQSGVSLPTSDQIMQEVYSLISLSPAPSAPAPSRSAGQQALYEYGNAAGLAVLAFADGHAGAPQVLKDWLADRANSSNIAAVNAIADGLAEAGKSLAGLPHVPPAAASANSALARSYEDAAAKLRSVIAAGGSGDAALVDAMKSYNSAADSYSASFIALADIFSIYDVKFGANDPGSAFQFQQ